MGVPGEAMAAARRVLGDVFGFPGFRPGQEAAIGALLAGHNALMVMPAGVIWRRLNAVCRSARRPRTSVSPSLPPGAVIGREFRSMSPIFSRN